MKYKEEVGSPKIKKEEEVINNVGIL